MVGLMGAEVIVSGLQDAVIETLIELGMILPNIQAVLDLDDALALSREERQLNGDKPTNSQANGYFNNYTELPLIDSNFNRSSFADLTEV